MPKAKPTQVIVHRIELQEKERELFDNVMKAQEAKSYATAVNKMVVPVVAAGGIVVGFMIVDGIYDIAPKIYDRIKSSVDKAKEDASTVATVGEAAGKTAAPTSPFFYAIEGVKSIFGKS